MAGCRFLVPGGVRIIQTKIDHYDEKWQSQSAINGTDSQGRFLQPLETHYPGTRTRHDGRTTREIPSHLSRAK